MSTQAEREAEQLGLLEALPAGIGVIATSAADRDAVWELRRESYREVVDRQFGGWEDTDQWPRFSERWTPERGLWLVRGVERLGYLVLQDRGDDLWLAEVQLLRGCRDQGHGTAVLLAIQDCAAQRNRPLRLRVLRENLRAIALYRRLGFQEEELTEDHHNLVWQLGDRLTGA